MTKEEQENLYNKWNGWLDTIRLDIGRILKNQNIYEKVCEVIEANPKIRSNDTFYYWMTEAYLTHGCVSIRRQVDRRDDVVSLARLLCEIIENPQVLSERRQVDPLDVANDLKMLVQKTRNIKKMTDKWVAHLDEKLVESNADYSQFVECLNCLKNLFKKYWLIFRGEDFASPALPLNPAWTRVFEFPWIKKEDAA